ncbi:MAG TPA: DUF3089 domain-containing protein [Methanocorpusculum sp.]|nr:DUF3089 domain-containing protein [Methanocorpusculum sp.]
MKPTYLIAAVLVIICCILAAGCVQTPAPAQETKIIPTDYSNPDNWMIQTKDPVQAVDLFYIYPTVVVKPTGDGIISDITEEMKNGAQSVFLIQGTAFAPYCNVYAPYYRQIAFENASQILDHYKYMDALRANEPKADIYAAIDYYFTNLNKGAERPFIIAGHSQGSAMVMLVLEEYMKDHPEYYKNMVAAYPIGWGVTQDWLDANPHLKFATGETDTGVIVSWNTETPSASMPSIVLGKETKAINPLTWTTEETYADKSLNKGSLVTTETTTTVVPGVIECDTETIIKAGLQDAQVNKKRGALICTTYAESDPISPDIFNAILGDGSLHGQDYGYYYSNIRENGFKRICAYLGYRPLVGTAQDYSLETNWMYYDTNPTKAADLFYVYPTVDMSQDKVAAGVSTSKIEDDSGMNVLVINGKYVKLMDVDPATPEVKAMAQKVYGISGKTFSEYTNVFAPYYRQIPIDRAVESTLHDEYLDIIRESRARTDLFAALDYYFENFNKGAERPYILAGHSQGSASLQVILEEYMAKHPEYYKNMVAAYVIGYGTEQAWYDANPHLKAARGETDTGVVVSYCTEGPGAKQYSMLIGDNALLINPLNWKTDSTYAGKSLNKGSLVTAADGSTSIVSGMHDAQVDNTRHALICTTDKNYLRNSNGLNIEKIFAEKSLHGDDYANYYTNLGENGKKRIDAFLAANK